MAGATVLIPDEYGTKIDFSEVKEIEITIREVWEALQKNGLRHLRENWQVRNGEGLVIGGCALGQAAFNLGVPYGEDFYGRYESSNLYGALASLPVPEKYREYGDNAGDAIIGINDAVRFTDNGNKIATYRLKNGKEGSVRYRFTYKEVVEKAYEILEPYFDKIISLPYVDYNNL